MEPPSLALVRRYGVYGRRSVRVAWALLIGVLSLALSPSAAEAVPETYIAAFSDPGEFTGGGEARFFHQGNTRFLISRSPTEISIQAIGGTREDVVLFDFAAPPGMTLAPGVYTGAQRTAFREGGRPGLDIAGPPRGCGDIDGQFEVRDLAFGPTGALERLWIVYEQRCERLTPAAFGEVRIGKPPPDSSSVLAPLLIRWPAADFGRPGTAVPVTVLARAPTQLEGASVTGADAADFEVVRDDCSGRRLSTGATCDVRVGFSPEEPGTSQATLRIPGTQGGAHHVALQGFRHGGRTRVLIDSDQGDIVGGGESAAYTPANADIEFFGPSSNVFIRVRQLGRNVWNAFFRAPEGQVLAPGSYPNAGWGASGPNPGLNVTGTRLSCITVDGSFTVSDAFFEPDGGVRNLGVTFEQRCGGAVAALRGTFEFRVGDTTTPSPWMVAGPVSPLPDPQPGGSTTASPVTTPPAVAPGRPSGGASPAPGASRVLGWCGDRRFASAKRVQGTRGPDRVRGGAGREAISTGAGNDRVRAGAGGDCVDGGTGRDTLDGGKGADLIAGGPGRDLLTGGAGRDILDCGRGKDIARIGPGDRVRGCERVLRPRRR